MSELNDLGVPEGAPPGFSCFKTYRPIRYQRRWFRLALVKAALDPTILKMGPSPVSLEKLPDRAEFAFWASTGVSSRLVIVTSALIDCTAVRVRMPVQVVHRSDLSKGAASAFAKAVWSCKRRKVSPLEQFSVAAIVRKAPLRSEFGLVMAEMAAIVGCPIGDTVEAIFAMIANGFLETDTSFGLGPNAPIWPGPLMRQGSIVPASGWETSDDQMDLFAHDNDPGCSIAF